MHQFYRSKDLFDTRVNISKLYINLLYEYLLLNDILIFVLPHIKRRVVFLELELGLGLKWDY